MMYAAETKRRHLRGLKTLLWTVLLLIMVFNLSGCRRSTGAESGDMKAQHDLLSRIAFLESKKRATQNSLAILTIYLPAR